MSAIFQNVASIIFAFSILGIGTFVALATCLMTNKKKISTAIEQEKKEYYIELYNDLSSLATTNQTFEHFQQVLNDWLRKEGREVIPIFEELENRKKEILWVFALLIIPAVFSPLAYLQINESLSLVLIVFSSPPLFISYFGLFDIFRYLWRRLWKC